MRVRRADFTSDLPRPMLMGMPSASLARTQPAAAPHDVERERDALARALAERWPRAVGGVLRLAARVDRHNRRAVALGLPPLAADPPLAAADALWAAIGAGDAGERRGCRAAGARGEAPQAGDDASPAPGCAPPAAPHNAGPPQAVGPGAGQ